MDRLDQSRVGERAGEANEIKPFSYWKDVNVQVGKVPKVMAYKSNTFTL